MMKTIVKSTFLLIALTVVLAASEAPPYRPRGWRPEGQTFNPAGQRAYGPPRPPSVYGPQGGNSPQLTTVAEKPTTTTMSTTTTTTTTSTTTPRSREPTTPFPEEEFQNGPALAVANSFAFNRPIYVYNSFPYYSGYTVLK